MQAYLLGEGNKAGPPFSRTFFNVTLGDLLKRSGGAETVRLGLYLTDGLRLEVCQIDSLEEQYMVVRGTAKDEEGCDLTVHVIPYGLIYRLEIVPKNVGDTHVGFTWKPGRTVGGKEGDA